MLLSEKSSVRGSVALSGAHLDLFTLIDILLHTLSLRDFRRPRRELTVLLVVLYAVSRGFGRYSLPRDLGCRTMHDGAVE